MDCATKDERHSNLFDSNLYELLRTEMERMREKINHPILRKSVMHCVSQLSKFENNLRNKELYFESVMENIEACQRHLSGNAEKYRRNEDRQHMEEYIQRLLRLSETLKNELADLEGATLMCIDRNRDSFQQLLMNNEDAASSD